MKNAGALLLGAAVVAGVVWVATKKSDKEAAPPQQNPTPSLPAYVPQELVDAYTKCYTTGCSFEEYKQVQTSLAALKEQHPELTSTWDYFMQELQKKAPLEAPQLPTDFDIKKTYQGRVDTCWYYFCDVEDVTSLTNALQTEWAKHVLDHPSVATSVIETANALMYYYGIPLPPGQFYQPRSTAGIIGRHTGACSCMKRQEEEFEALRNGNARSVGHEGGACCASCASGGECEECSEEKEERGVG